MSKGGTGKRGRGDAGISGTQGRGDSGTWKAGTRDAKMLGLGDVGRKNSKQHLIFALNL